MNKIFKVVWSKSKECYVVVSEVAKNNGGKKKVLASVLAGLAMVGAGAVGTGVQAADSNSATTMNSSKQINVWATTNENNATARQPGSGTANANDVRESQYGDEISVAIGAKNVVRSTDTANQGGGSSVALGNKNTLKGNRNVAVGTGNKTYGEDSIAVGSNVTVATGRGIAIGNDYQSSHTIAYGSSEPSETGVTGNAFALAIGNGAQADGRANHASGGIAIGQDVKATHNNTIAIGVQTTASGSNSTVVGGSAVASGSSSAAYGTQSNAKGIGAAAIGPGATTDGDGATALGRASSAKAESATALGRNAEATIAEGVALGYKSVTTTAAGVQGYNPADSRTNKYSTQSGAVGTSTLAAVSVGNGTTATRQITGLAAGKEDTDAVNVAQLKNVNLKYAADTGNSDVLLKDGTLTVNGDNDIISTSVESNGAIKVTAKKGANITTNNDGKAVAPTTNGIATTDNVTQAINNSGWKVTSANNGGTTNGTTSEKVRPGNTVTFSAGKNIVLDQAGKQFTYSLNKDVDLTNGGSLTIGDTVMNNGGMSITGGPSVTKTGIDAGSKKITNVAKGTDDTDAVNYSQIKDLRTEVKAGTGVNVAKTQGADGHDIYTVSSNATGGTASTESVVKKAAASGDTNIADVSVAGGKNVNDPGAQYEVSVSKNAVKDAAREAVTVNNGGNTDNPITVTPTDDASKHNTTYAVTFDGNKAAKQIPLTYKANGTGDKTVTLDKGLNFTNGTNTTAAIDNDGVVKFNLNDNVALTNAGSLTVGDTKVNNDGLTITGGPSVTKNGIDAGNQKITNVSPGTISSTSTDAVNGSQLYTVDQKFNNTVKLIGNAGATDGQALNKANGLSFGVIGADNGKYISTSATGSDVTVDLSTDAKKLLNNTVEVQGKNAATVTSSTVATADGGTKTIYTVDVASTGSVAKSSWNIKSSADTANGGAEATGHEAAAKNIADTNTVEMSAGKNLTVKQTSDANGAKVEFALNKDLKDLTSVATDKVTTKEITLKDPNGTGETVIKKDGDRITYSNDGGNTVNKVANLKDEKHIAPGSYAVQNDGSVTMTYVDGNGDPVSNEEAKITGIAKQDLSNIDNAGKNVITGLGTVVKAGDNVTVSEASDTTTGQKTYTVNAVTPAVYTKKDGTKVVKRPDGTFTTNVDGSAGNNVDPSDVIVSFQDAAGNTTGGNSIINNVGSAIDKTGTSTGDTFLTKLDTAATDTPNAAVNVKDLKNTSDAIIGKGLKFDANEGGEKTNKLGSKVTIQGSGALAAGKAYADEYNTANIRTNIEQGADGNTTINVGLAKALKDINSISNGNSSITISDVPAGTSTPAVTISGGNLSMGDGTTNNKIVNLAPGTDDNDAVNVKQLKDTELHITPGTYTPDANKKVKLTYTDGNNQVVNGKEAVIDLSGITTGGTASSWNVKSSANTTDGGAVADTHDANAQNIADTKTVEFQSGKNLVVKQTNDTANGNATVEFSLSDNITAGKDGANGKDGSVGATGKDGASVVLNGKDGSIGMTGPKGQDGKDGINGRDGANISITSAKGEQVLTNRDPAHNSDTDKAERIVYVPKDANGNPIQGADGKNIVREVATMDDGLKFTGNNESTVNKQQLGSLVKVQGEGTKEGTDTAGAKEIQTSDGTKFESAKDNIAVEADGANTLTVKLNKDLKGLNSVTTEKVITKEIDLSDPHGTTTATIKYDDNRITYTNDGGQHEYKVANLNDEKHITQGVYTVGDKSIDSKAANDEVTLTYTSGYDELIRDKDGNPITTKIKGIAKSDLSNITDAGKNVITGLGTVVKAGDNVTVSEASDATTGQKTYTVNAVTPAVYTKADGTKVVKRPDGTFTTNVDGAPGNDVPASDVIVSFQDAAGNRTGGNSIVNNVGSAIDKAGTSTGDTFLTNLNNAATATPFAAVNVRDLKSTADALKASELHIAPTAVKAGSTEAKGGVANGAENVYKYDAATKKVTLTYNDGNGKAVTDTKAVIDFTDLNVPAGGNNYGFKANATANGGTVEGTATETAVENGGTVNFAAGKNLTVKQDIDTANKTHTYTFSLDKDLTNLDKVVVNGKDGIAGKDGVTIVGPQGATGATGIPGTNGIDGKVGITGKDGKDAVSIAGKDGVGTIGLTGPQGPAGTNGKSVDISTENGTKTLFKPEANNNDQSQRIVYVPKDANGNPLKDADNNDIKREVATMDDGLRFTGNNTSTENKQKLGSLVKVEGEGVTEAQANSFQSAAGNIAVVANGADTLTVKLNKDLKGLDSVTTKEVKLGDANDNISIKKDGDRITYSTDGGTTVNKVANLADEQHIKDTTYTVDTDKKVKLTYVDGNGKDVTGKTAIIDLSGLPVGDKDTDMRIKEGDYTAKNGSVTLNTVDKDGNPVAGKDVVIKGINTNNYQAGDNVTFTNDGSTDPNGNPIVKINAKVSTEQVVAKAGNDNLATVAPATGSTQGGKNATYEVNVDKTNLENKAEISYKASTSNDAGSQTAKKTTLADGFDFTSDDHSVAITTGANGKVNFKVDTTGIQGKAFNLNVEKEGTGKVENAQTVATTPSVEKGTKFVAGNNLSIRHDAINGDANYDHKVTYALNSDLKGITSITNNGGATMNFGPNEISMTGGNLNMGDNKITNVKNGTDKSDVATVGQLTKVTSNDNSVSINKSTDADGAPVYDLSVQGGRDPRVDELGEEIGRVGAQGAALAALKPIQYDPLEPTQIMAGYGNYRGNSAIAMGVAHYKNESTLMHAGLSWAGGSRHMMANAGVTWKVGNRDSEAAVADRYRKGPISSAYAMQQEMASVKAQNAGLKTEVSDLKAENEQMKAQIAAMMAKLGM
ncbi:ESPR-type extended signal peptide-containing protein [uncultured Veillonella sp.]|uniref:ESPR-type extended signal peptide-containing protein n=1 Tax=uncultured Veillonella sp. TaxID=159268 RepID=UPI0028D132B5|nr:ESPR-type extended signal peptide-containing protein [uncultured Veillonella sp.]